MREAVAKRRGRGRRWLAKRGVFELVVDDLHVVLELERDEKVGERRRVKETLKNTVHKTRVSMVLDAVIER